MSKPDLFTYSITESVEIGPEGLQRRWVVTFWSRRTGNWAGAADHLATLPEALAFALKPDWGLVHQVPF